MLVISSGWNFMVCLLGSSVDTNKDRNRDTNTDTIQSDCNSPTYGLVRRMLLEDGVFDGNIWSVPIWLWHFGTPLVVVSLILTISLS